MKYSILVVAAALVAVANSLEREKAWQEYKLNFKKNYRNIQEETRRFQVFQDKLLKIEEHNEKYEKGEVTYYMGLNQFSDLTHEEYLHMLTLHKRNTSDVPNLPKRIFKIPEGVDIPDSIDWRSQNVVSEVKNQGPCGSCWAFSSTGGLEGQYAIKYHQVISLSEQNLLDCSNGIYGNGDCDTGGVMLNSWAYVKDNGINSENDYPYEHEQKNCRYNPQKKILHISGYEKIEENEEALRYAVALNGPISIAVDFSLAGGYAGGVFNDPNCHNKRDDLNHGVLVVGYGVDNGTPYWIVKNSWSDAFGEQGYIRMIRNANNQCGIVDDASRPLVM